MISHWDHDDRQGLPQITQKQIGKTYVLMMAVCQPWKKAFSENPEWNFRGGFLLFWEKSALVERSSPGIISDINQ